jgi:hypothetical protein
MYFFKKEPPFYWFYKKVNMGIRVKGFSIIEIFLTRKRTPPCSGFAG